MPTVLTNSSANKLTCLGCGLVCDDIEQKDARLNVQCHLAHDFFSAHHHDSPETYRIGGKPATLDAALDEAAKILTSSRSPLMYGLAQSTVAAQRAAIALADRLGAYSDPALTEFDRAALVALQSTGLSTCTLGEVRQRADLVLFWGCDPQQTHPRLWERVVDTASPWIPRGRANRTIISCRSTKAEFCSQADSAIELSPNDSFAALHWLRTKVSDKQLVPTSLPKNVASQLATLAERLRAAQYAVVFFGPELAPPQEESAHLESLFLLVRALNHRGRCAAIGLSGLLTENVLTWQTGYPCGVNFAAGYPEYAPFEYSADQLLESAQVDAIVTVGSHSLKTLPPSARQAIAQLKWISFSAEQSNDIGQPSVDFLTRHPADAGDLVFRLDGVPLHLPAAAPTNLPTEAALLRQLLDLIQS